MFDAFLEHWAIRNDDDGLRSGSLAPYLEQLLAQSLELWLTRVEASQIRRGIRINGNRTQDIQKFGQGKCRTENSLSDVKARSCRHEHLARNEARQS